MVKVRGRNANGGSGRIFFTDPRFFWPFLAVCLTVFLFELWPQTFIIELFQKSLQDQRLWFWSAVYLFWKCMQRSGKCKARAHLVLPAELNTLQPRRCTEAWRVSLSRVRVCGRPLGLHGHRGSHGRCCPKVWRQAEILWVLFARQKYCWLLGNSNTNLPDGDRVDYVMASKSQWKPFWLASELYLQNDWAGWQHLVTFDEWALAPLVSPLQRFNCGNTYTNNFALRTCSTCTLVGQMWRFHYDAMPDCWNHHGDDFYT